MADRMTAGRYPRSTSIRRLVLTVALPALLAGILPVTPPGLCPCWLLDHIHPHPFAHSELPHSHDYLFWMFSADTAETPPALPTSSEVHARLLSLNDLWSEASEPLPGSPAWSGSPSKPPPRLLSWV